jgi:hypothetical protein
MSLALWPRRDDHPLAASAEMSRYSIARVMVKLNAAVGIAPFTHSVR